MLTIHFDPVIKRRAVSIHLWEKPGHVWDREGVLQEDGTFLFQLDDCDGCDLSQLRFKFRFPMDNDSWEPDPMIRFLPPSSAKEWWTFAFSPRCVTENPSTGGAVTELVVQARTSKFLDGAIYVWQPVAAGAPNSESIAASGTDPATGDAIFRIPLREWMTRGFHFKLRKWDCWEPDEANRVWRPGDGGQIWIKSGQNIVRSAPLQTITIDAVVVAPKLKPGGESRTPVLQLKDSTDEFQAQFEPQHTESLDDLLQKTSSFADKKSGDPIRLYQGGVYWLKTDWEGDENNRVIIAESSQTIVIVEGDRRFFDTVPQRTVDVEVVVHRNDRSAFGTQVPIRVGIGNQPPYEQVQAVRTGETWNARIRVFPDIACWFDIAPTGGIAESRPDGPFCTKRVFQLDSAKTLHTRDGMSGWASTQGMSLDVPLSDRKNVLRRAFSPAVVDARVFEEFELPLGATVLEDTVWFVVTAPHAVRSRLLLLDRASRGPGRSVKTYEMKLTSDLRYWWCEVPKVDAPHGTSYRFLFNDDQEVLDPAARWTNGTDRLWANPGEGTDGPWAKVVDRKVIRDHFARSPWRTMGWEALMIYEMHPLRFSARKMATAGAFDRIKAEVVSGGYLHDLGVTALETMPLNEYPKAAGWGYDPSLYFAIEASYGGPEKFAELVRTCHDNGKAVIVDVVFNHAGNECPLQAVAGDVYFEGETCWGAMVNFDHPVAKQFFRQALLHMWDSFDLDGFRFDCTRAIIQGNGPVEGSVRKGGSGGGWEFLGMLTGTLRRSAEAALKPWPYTVAEQDPIDKAITRCGITDGQWHFAHLYALGEEACGKDKTYDICQQMNIPHSDLRPFYEAVRCVCTHDACSLQEDWKKRVAARAPFDTGYQMAKAMAASTILAKGVPMIFMGQEVGENQPFHFGMDNLSDLSRYLRLDDYGSGDHQKIRVWFSSLFGLRRNPGNCIQGDDDQQVGRGNKTIAFTRGWGKFFVIATFGTPDTVQDLAWLGLPGGAAYKEIFNSSWPVFNVKMEQEHSNGSYWAQLRSGDRINLPPTGAVILERI